MLAGLLRTSNLVGPQQPRFDAAGAKDVPTIWIRRPTNGLLLLLLFVVAIRYHCKGIQANATRSRNQPLPAGRRRRRLLVASFQYSSSIVVLIISISIIMLVISIPIRSSSSSSSRPNRHTRRWYPPLEHSRSSTQRIVVVIIVITVLALWFDHPVPMRLAQRHGIRLQRFRELGEQPLLLGGCEMMMRMMN